jgi:Alpha/beta hydrolase domain
MHLLQKLAVAQLLACALLTAPAVARVTEINVVAVEPFAEAAAFGDTGAYERVRGTFKGELDPADARNKVIINLDRAPRNAAGRVEYEADFFLLRPANAVRGNNKLIYDVTNRGRKYIHWRLMDAKPASVSVANDPRTLADAGNGLFLREGYTIVWSGWDPDAPRNNNGMTMKPVIATDNGAPIVRTVRNELVSGTRITLRETFRLTDEAATLDQSQATLTVRRREADPRVTVPASGWAYVNSREIRLLPAGNKPEPGSIYELHYPAKNPRVLGIGFAATRDLISFLRFERQDSKGTPNPIGAEIRATLGFGISQSGRFLRDFVHQGFNQDENKRKVFDGLLAHTAGAGGVFLNAEFGQPDRTNTQFENHTMPENAFPFSTASMKDPATGKSGGLMRGDGFAPLWIETNTSTEYWQKGASLLVTTPLAERDVELPANARAFLIAGTQHGGQAWMTSNRGKCVNPNNPHSPTPGLRALLSALSEWVDGKTPPPTRTPRLGDGTLIPVSAFKFPDIPGVAVARRVNEIGVLKDWVKPDMDMSKPYQVRITAVDSDGNETAGIRLPEIAVPLGTYTGWNFYRAPFVEGELCDRDGTYIPFAATAAERAAKGDPRPSLEERYGNHAAYVQKMTRAAAQLVSERMLLQEDAERLIARAKGEEVAKLFTRP